MISDAPRSLKDQKDRPRISLFRHLFPVNSDIAIISMIAIWGAYFLFAAIHVQILQPPSPERVMWQYLLLTILALVATWILYRVLVFLGSGRISSGLTMLTIPGLVFALLISWLGFEIVDAQASFAGDFGQIESTRPAAADLTKWLVATLVHFLILVSWGCAYLAYSHDRATQSALENSRILDRLNRESELRALAFSTQSAFCFQCAEFRQQSHYRPSQCRSRAPG